MSVGNFHKILENPANIRINLTSPENRVSAELLSLGLPSLVVYAIYCGDVSESGVS